jgi:hypothetical protein
MPRSERDNGARFWITGMAIVVLLMVYLIGESGGLPWEEVSQDLKPQLRLVKRTATDQATRSCPSHPKPVPQFFISRQVILLGSVGYCCSQTYALTSLSLCHLVPAPQSPQELQQHRCPCEAQRWCIQHVSSCGRRVRPGTGVAARIRLSGPLLTVIVPPSLSQINHPCLPEDLGAGMLMQTRSFALARSRR